MATATPLKSVITINKPVRVHQVDGVTLSLNAKEAAALRAVLGLVGGCPDTSPRKYTQDILEALKGAGVVWPTPSAFRNKGQDPVTENSSIHFKRGTLERFDAVVTDLTQQVAA